MKPQKKDLKKVHDKMQSFEDKGSYLLTLEMFKSLNEYFCHPEENEEN